VSPDDVAAKAEAELAAARAEIERLTAFQVRHNGEIESYCRYAREAEAALARVRDLCDAAAVWTEQGYGWTTVDEIRAAIEGDNR
jgi:multidrug resistance efflux pump